MRKFFCFALAFLFACNQAKALEFKFDFSSSSSSPVKKQDKRGKKAGSSSPSKKEERVNKKQHYDGILARVDRVLEYYGKKEYDRAEKLGREVYDEIRNSGSEEYLRFLPIVTQVVAMSIYRQKNAERVNEVIDWLKRGMADAELLGLRKDKVRLKKWLIFVYQEEGRFEESLEVVKELEKEVYEGCDVLDAKFYKIKALLNLGRFEEAFGVCKAMRFMDFVRCDDKEKNVRLNAECLISAVNLAESDPKKVSVDELKKWMKTVSENLIWIKKNLSEEDYPGALITLWRGYRILGDELLMKRVQEEFIRECSRKRIDICDWGMKLLDETGKAGEVKWP